MLEVGYYFLLLKGPSASLAAQHWSAAVGFKMLRLVRKLVEGFVAAEDRAHEGPLPSVNADVVEKIMPLFKHHFTLLTRLVANEDALLALSPHVSELDLEIIRA